MKTKKNLKFDDEINLDKFILLIWKNKILILLMGVIFAALGALYQSPKDPPKVYFSSTEIKPISRFEEFEYQHYNNYIVDKNLSGKMNLLSTSNNQSGNIDDIKIIYNPFRELTFKDEKNLFTQINKSYLLILFIEKIKETKFLQNEIKKSKLIKIDDFKNIEEYNDKVIELASSIVIKKNPNDNSNTNWSIDFKTSNTKGWNNFLIKLEKNTNLEVRKYLQNSFERQISDKEKFKNYQIEDIDDEIYRVKDDKDYKNYLFKLKKRLIDNKDVNRLENAFQSTPIVNTNDFLAARIMNGETKLEPINVSQGGTNYIIHLSAILGVIISIFYVLVSSYIKEKYKI